MELEFEWVFFQLGFFRLMRDDLMMTIYDWTIWDLDLDLGFGIGPIEGRGSFQTETI